MAENERTVWQLARLAGCLDPDTLTSAGAAWLRNVESAAAELIEEADDPRDAVTECADAIVPVYTGERWRIFADLGAWEQDIDDYTDANSGDTDLTSLAGVALYRVAEALIFALIDEHETEAVDDEN